MREKLTESMSEDLAANIAKSDKHHRMAVFARRPTLEYYYLPVVTLTNLNFLWESYFCWYEFDINSAVALILTIPAAAFLLWVRFRHSPIVLTGLILLLLALGCVVCKMLTSAAVKNLVSYEKNLMLLISGTLANDAKKARPPAPNGA